MIVFCIEVCREWGWGEGKQELRDLLTPWWGWGWEGGS